MIQLNKRQRDQVMLLGKRGAIDQESGLDRSYSVQPATIGSLITNGLAAKATRRRFLVKRTVYWLTDAGMAEFQRESERPQ